MCFQCSPRSRQSYGQPWMLIPSHASQVMAFQAYWLKVRPHGRYHTPFESVARNSLLTPKKVNMVANVCTMAGNYYHKVDKLWVCGLGKGTLDFLYIPKNNGSSGLERDFCTHGTTLACLLLLTESSSFSFLKGTTVSWQGNSEAPRKQRIPPSP